MDYDTFQPIRARLARQLYNTLTQNPPPGALEVHEPDSLGGVGIKFPDGYILVQVEEVA
jgi:hypothetical protein